MINIRHIGIVVQDVQKSIDFYLSLGFVKGCCRAEGTTFIDCISAGKNIHLITTRLATPNGDMIELLDYGKHTTTKANTLFGNGIAHFAVTVIDIEALYYRGIQNGVCFISPPEVSPNGYAKVAFCQAPEGSFIELVEVLQTGN